MPSPSNATLRSKSIFMNNLAVVLGMDMGRRRIEIYKIL
jgi:hypothetical protein